MVAYLWPDKETLSLFLVGLVIFYFTLLYETHDIWIFLAATGVGWYVGTEISTVSVFAYPGFIPFGIPLWPIAWGLIAVGLRKFFLISNIGFD